jgi:hypothetical protein
VQATSDSRAEKRFEWMNSITSSEKLLLGSTVLLVPGL